MPTIGSPTALIMSWSAAKPGSSSGILVERRRDELLDEVDAHAAGQEEVHASRLGGADLRQLGGVVELAELGVDLGGDLALVACA